MSSYLGFRTCSRGPAVYEAQGKISQPADVFAPWHLGSIGRKVESWRGVVRSRPQKDQASRIGSPAARQPESSIASVSRRERQASLGAVTKYHRLKMASTNSPRPKVLLLGTIDLLVLASLIDSITGVSACPCHNTSLSLRYVRAAQRSQDNCPR